MLAVRASLEDIRSAAAAVVHPTGAGKTALAVNLVGASQHAKQTLGWAPSIHRDVVIVTERAGMLNMLAEFDDLGWKDVGCWGLGQRDLNHPVVIAMIHVIQRNRSRLKSLLGSGSVDLLVGDEADVFLTQSRREAVDALRPRVKVGFTATKQWNDGRHVSQVWGDVVSEIDLLEGIERGINVPPVWRLYQADLDGDALPRDGDDYREKELAAGLKHAAIHLALPELYAQAVPEQERAAWPTLVYVPSTDLVALTAGAFVERFPGLRVEAWTGTTTSSGQMKRDTAALKAGALDVLVCCEMGGRSLDVPRARLLLDGYPTLSRNKLLQRHGRILRRLRGQEEKKPFAVILQVVPRSRGVRSVCLPDVLEPASAPGEAWEDAIAGRPLGMRRRRGDVGAPSLDAIRAVLDRLEAGHPAIRLHLIGELDMYRRIASGGQPDMTVEQLRDEFISRYKPQQWALMRHEVRKEVMVCGLTLKAIARRFGVEGNPVGNNSAHLSLGRAIWGEAFGDPKVAVREALRAELRARYGPDQWAVMPFKESSKIEVSGYKLDAIARQFGIKEHAHIRSVHLALGRAIWGEAFGDPQVARREAVRVELLARYTPEQWAEMTREGERSEIKVSGYKIIAIARLFGVKGSPLNVHAVHLALGRAIWGKRWREPQSE